MNVAVHDDERPPSIPMDSHDASFAMNSIIPNRAAVNAAYFVPFLVPWQRLYCSVLTFAVDSMDVAWASCAELDHCPTVNGCDDATVDWRAMDYDCCDGSMRKCLDLLRRCYCCAGYL